MWRSTAGIDRFASRVLGHAGEVAPPPGPSAARGSETLARRREAQQAIPPPRDRLLMQSNSAYTRLSAGAHTHVFHRVRARPGPLTSARAFEEAMREEDVPAQQPEAQEDARIPDPDAYPRGTRRHRASAQQGPREPLCLIWRVGDREMFRALARGRRRRAGALEVSAADVGHAGEPPRVAFAVGRNVGGAVVRNRVRRRLRAASREHSILLEPGRGYLVRASSSAASATYRELADALRSALAAHRGEGAY